jgi:hypothetical protein
MKQSKKKTKAASKKTKSGRKQASRTSSTEQSSEIPPTVRFSATIHAREQTERADPNWIEKLDIDRVPDPTGLIRALVTLEDCVRLVNQGVEVRLHNAYPVEPLNPSLIETDDSFKRWLDAKMASIKGANIKGAREQKESKRT